MQSEIHYNLSIFGFLVGSTKDKIKNTIFLLVDIFSLGGIPLALLANYPGQIATLMERIILSFPTQTLNDLGKACNENILG